MRRFLFFALSAGLPAFAGEYATLTSGARIKADRHETNGSMIRLFQGQGITDLPASLIVDFEPFDDPAPPPAAKPAEPVPAPAQVASLTKNPRELVRDAALREGLPPEFVASVAKVESAFQPNAVSPKGAIGVMQLMPATAKTLGADPYDVGQNIDAGTRLLRDLLLKYDGDVVKALSAYNAGEGAVARYQGLPPYSETRAYVNKVIGSYLVEPSQGGPSKASQ